MDEFCFEPLCTVINYFEEEIIMES